MFSYSRKSAQNYEIIPIFATACRKFLEMKSLTLIVFTLFINIAFTFAQTEPDLSPDSILDEYEVLHQGEYARVRISHDSDSTYMAQVFWIDDMYDKHGRVRVDERNPDKMLRNVPCNQIVLMTGLKYDQARKRWGDTKIYDPTRVLFSNVTCEFKEEKGLRVRMSFLCFSQVSWWKKLD